MNPEHLRATDNLIQATFNVDATGAIPQQDPVRSIADMQQRQSLEEAHQEGRGPRRTVNWIRFTDLLKRINQIGQIDYATGNRVRPVGSPELVRFNEANSRSTIVRKMAREGYDSLTLGERATLRTIAREVLNNIPAARDFFRNRNTARNRAIERIVRDPELMVQVQDVLNEFLDIPSNTFTEPTDNVVEQRAGLRRNNRDLTTTLDRQNELDVAVANVDAELATFAAPAGAFYLELQNLESPIGGNVLQRQAVVNALQNFITQSQERIRLIQANIHAIADPAQRAALANEVLNLDQNIQTATAQIAPHMPFVNRYRQLTDHRQVLNDQRRQLAEQSANNAGALPDANEAQNEGQRRLVAARGDRVAEELGLVNSVNHILRVALHRAIVDQLFRVEGVQLNLVREYEQNSPNPAELAINNALLNRWETRARRRVLGLLVRREVNRRHQETVDADLHALMTGGPRALVDRILVDENIGALARLRAINNPEFMNKVSMNVITTLLRRYWSKHKLSSNDVRRIAESPWGQNIVQVALEKGDAVTEQILGAADKGLTKGFIKDWLSKHSDAQIAALLAAGLGLGAGTYYGGPAIAASAAA